MSDAEGWAPADGDAVQLDSFQTAQLNASRWNKRTYTAEEATERRRLMAQSAGSSTLEMGLVLARNNEVREVKAAATLPVPAGVALVASDALITTMGGTELEAPCVVEWLEALCEDAPLVSQDAPPAQRRCFYALFSGHGAHGGEIAAWVARELPSLLAGKLAGVPASESAAIKEGVKMSFGACNAQLLLLAEERGWTGGCTALGLLLDLHATPPRAYVASLGASQAHACVKEQGSSATKAIGVSKNKPGRALGASSELLPSSAAPSPLPDVTSFDVQPAQRFVLLGSAGMWRCLTGQRAVEMLATRLHMMDARRVELEGMLGTPPLAVSECFSAPSVFHSLLPLPPSTPSFHSLLPLPPSTPCLRAHSAR